MLTGRNSGPGNKGKTLEGIHNGVNTETGWHESERAVETVRVRFGPEMLCMNGEMLLLCSAFHQGACRDSTDVALDLPPG